MDLKALMQTLETIDKKEVLTEAEKKETTWTDKSGKKHPATSVKGDKYTGKEAEKEAKPKKDDLDESVLTSAIARELLKEFGIQEEETIDEAGNPWANDPAKSAAWAALTPQDQKWLGGADPTDPYILARAPNKGKPAASALPTGMTQADVDQARNATEPDAVAQAPADGAATKPAAVDPAVAATREKFKALMDKLEKTGGVSGSPAAGAATKPAAAAPSGAQAAGQSVGGAIKSGAQAVGDFAKGAYQGLTKESVTFEDDKTLLAIKNIRF
jgi:hypothetical protein